MLCICTFIHIRMVMCVCVCVWSLIWNRICYACRICILCKMRQQPWRIRTTSSKYTQAQVQGGHPCSSQHPTLAPIHSTGEPTRPIQIFACLSSDWDSLPVNIVEFCTDFGLKFIMHTRTCKYIYMWVCRGNLFVTLAFRSFVRSFTSPWKGGQ